MPGLHVHAQEARARRVLQVARLHRVTVRVPPEQLKQEGDSIEQGLIKNTTRYCFRWNRKHLPLTAAPLPQLTQQKSTRTFLSLFVFLVSMWLQEFSLINIS